MPKYTSASPWFEPVRRKRTVAVCRLGQPPGALDVFGAPESLRGQIALAGAAVQDLGVGTFAAPWFVHPDESPDGDVPDSVPAKGLDNGNET